MLVRTALCEEYISIEVNLFIDGLEGRYEYIDGGYFRALLLATPVPIQVAIYLRQLSRRRKGTGR